MYVYIYYVLIISVCYMKNYFIDLDKNMLSMMKITSYQILDTETYPYSAIAVSWVFFLIRYDVMFVKYYPVNKTIHNEICFDQTTTTKNYCNHEL